MNRGDVVLAEIPNVGTTGGVVRPALVVQADYLNVRIQETTVAAITSNISRAHEDHQYLLDHTHPDWAASGLLHDSAIRCERLHVIPQADVRRDRLAVRTDHAGDRRVSQGGSRDFVSVGRSSNGEFVR